jgi:phenylacetate-coenzyme A ligase PaaK-like adenylate-forming protein
MCATPTSPQWGAGLAAWQVLAATSFGPFALQWHRTGRLQALLRAARASPLYAERLATAGGVFEQMRPVGKRELMGRFEEWVTDPAIRLARLRRFLSDPGNIGKPFNRRWYAWESSGSSGVPGIFVQDAAAMEIYDALEGLRRPPSWRRWLDPLYANERIAFVGAIEGHFASIVNFARIRREVPGMAARMRAFSFLQPMPALVAQLQAWQPTVLATYPSTAVALAAEASVGRRQLPLTEIWTGGEALSRAARAQISRTFGCPVMESYGASEFLPLAAECPAGRLHLNDDWAILESVDEHHRPVPRGEVGATTLLTNLANHVQPIIRYDLSDRVRIGAIPCGCGSLLPTIEVEGRVDDTLTLVSRKGGEVALLPLALTSVLEDEGGVCDFQLACSGPRSLQLAFPGTLDAPAARHAREALVRYLESLGLADVQVRVTRSDALFQGRSGKRPRIVNRPDAKPQRAGRSEFRM